MSTAERSNTKETAQKLSSDRSINDQIAICNMALLLFSNFRKIMRKGQKDELKPLIYDTLLKDKSYFLSFYILFLK